MLTWHFRATTASGELREGAMAAEGREAVVQNLRARRLTPLQVTRSPVRAAFAWRPAARAGRSLTARELGFFTMELATLLDAGVPLVRALELLGGLARSEGSRALFTRLHARVRAGAAFSAAIAEDEQSFGRFYVSLVCAGEQSGALELTLRRLAEHLQRAAELRESLLAALWYPAILLLVAVLSMALIVGVVVPRFAHMFADAGQALPWPTQVLLWTGECLREHGWLLALALAGIALLARRLLQDPSHRLRMHTLVLRLPLAGRLVSEQEAARFTRTLATLLGGGVTLADALPVARQAVANLCVAAALDHVTGQVRAGRRLAAPLMEANVFPPLVGEMVEVGEASGQLAAMLSKVARTCEREVSAALARLVALAGPAVILVLGALIALIIMSILAAVLGVNELVA